MHLLKNVTMRVGLAAASIAGVMLASAPASLAAPVAPVTGQAAAIAADSSLVTPVSGRHNDCRRHYVPRWGTTARHRHVGPGEVPVACGRRWEGRGDPPRWRNRGCFRIGPVWYCP